MSIWIGYLVWEELAKRLRDQYQSNCHIIVVKILWKHICEFTLYRWYWSVVTSPVLLSAITPVLHYTKNQLVWSCIKNSFQAFFAYCENYKHEPSPCFWVATRLHTCVEKWVPKFWSLWHGFNGMSKVPGMWEAVSHILGPRPPSFTAPSNCTVDRRLWVWLKTSCTSATSKVQTM